MTTEVKTDHTPVEEIANLFVAKGFKKPCNEAIELLYSPVVTDEKGNTTGPPFYLMDLTHLLELYKQFELVPPVATEVAQLADSANFDQFCFFLWSRRIFTPYMHYEPQIIATFFAEWAVYETDEEKNILASYSELEPVECLGYNRAKWLAFFRSIKLDQYFNHQVNTSNLPKERKAKARYLKKNKKYDVENKFNRQLLQKHFKIEYTNKAQFMNQISNLPIYKLYAILICVEAHTMGKQDEIAGKWEFIAGKKYIEESEESESSDSDSDNSSEDSSQNSNSEEEEEETPKKKKKQTGLGAGANPEEKAVGKNHKKNKARREKLKAKKDEVEAVLTA